MNKEGRTDEETGRQEGRTTIVPCEAEGSEEERKGSDGREAKETRRKDGRT